jgi:ABC-2 type transport system ATP-binding protein
MIVVRQSPARDRVAGRFGITMVAATTSTAPADAAPRPSREAVVVVQHLTKTFRDFWMRARVRAVEDVSFDIYRGEIFGLLGPNGSGKSTTIKILLGLLHKTSGRVSVFGGPPSDVAIKKRIGYLPEESYLYPFLNARETLEYYAKLFGLPAGVRERRINELLAMVGLTSVQYRPVREYSKGMQRRIGIAQALINDPELLILDEPTTGLDPIGTRQIKDLIIQLGRRGKTVLLSSHLLADVEDCVDRMVILYGGKVQAEGTCDQLLEARDRTMIETDALDDATISRIDEIIRERSHGAKAITRVSRPRQKLEELFVDIVERARAAKIETYGAQHGGETASFLRGEEPEGGDVVRALVDAGRSAEPIRREVEPAKPAAPAGPDRDVLSELLKPAAPPEPPPAARPAASPRSGPAQPPADVDMSVLDSLLDGDAKNDGSGGTKR